MKILFPLLILLLLNPTTFAQQAKLDTVLKPHLKPKINIYYAPESKAYEVIHHHGNPANFIINSKVKFFTRKPILNPNNLEEIKIEKPNILIKYKIDSVEILTISQLLKKYCKVALEEEKLLIKIDDELQRYPDSVYIAIDAIKRIQIDTSDNYPSLKLTSKSSFKIIDIKIYKLGEEKDDGKPKIMIR